MGDLSTHFSRREFDCPHCGKSIISQKLVDALESLRVLANRAIRITSAYRCPEHNKAIGGAVASQHVLGTAADIAIDGFTVEQMYALAEQVEAFSQGGLGLYDDGHLHVDIRAWRARWGKVKGKEVSVQDFFAQSKPTGLPGASS